MLALDLEAGVLKSDKANVTLPAALPGRCGLLEGAVTADLARKCGAFVSFDNGNASPSTSIVSVTYPVAKARCTSTLEGTRTLIY
ncbi:MAG: hypothetical protein EOP39_06620 [Rubrivivax sp.]|nr:MAG: hypothetical protein EOP39_06620 [Rubrivivax sp.]